MNWKSKLESLGMQESDLSVRIKKIVKDYYEIESGLAQAEEAMSSGSLSESDLKETKETIKELEDALSNLNDNLVYEVEKYHKNKDVYAAKSQNLKNGKAKAAATKDTTTAATTTKAAAPQPPVAGVSVTKPQPVATAQQGGAVATEKKGGWGKWILFGALALIGGGVALNYVNSGDE